MVADADGNLLFFNAAAEKILGGSATKANPAEWGGAYGWYLPDQNTLLAAEQLPLARAIRGEEFSDELIFVRSPQQPSGVFISVSGRAVRSVMGLTGGVVIFHDATEQQRSLQMNVLLTQVVEQIGDCVILTDKQGVIQYVNPAFESITGYSREEVLGKLREQLQTRLRNGSEVVSLEVPVEPHPLAKFAGMFKDDPLFDDWQKAIAEYRRRVDDDPDYL